jgi:hypothetical protein
MAEKYPNFEDIKVEWTKGKSLLIFVVTFCLILILVNEEKLKPITNAQYLNIAGLYIDFLGVIIATLKTPYYGIFPDAGKLEIERQKVENKYFKIAIFLIVIGMLLQALSTLNNFNFFLFDINSLFNNAK